MYVYRCAVAVELKHSDWLLQNEVLNEKYLDQQQRQLKQQFCWRQLPTQWTSDSGYSIQVKVRNSIVCVYEYVQMHVRS